MNSVSPEIGSLRLISISRVLPKAGIAGGVGEYAHFQSGEGELEPRENLDGLQG